MRRATAWLLTSALAAAGALLAHELAYRATGTPPGAAHAYLSHAPQALLVVVSLALAAAALGGGGRAPRAWPFPLVALAAFAAQEHLEGALHGDAALRLQEPSFLVGLALQAPVALAAWALARRLLRALRPLPLREPRLLAMLPLDLAPPATRGPARVAVRARRGRAPPHAPAAV